MIGIDDRGFDTNDVLINSVVLDEVFLKLLNAWIPIFEKSGINFKQSTGSLNFFERGETKVELEKLFQTE